MKMRRSVKVGLFSIILVCNVAVGQVIDFETLPDGTPTYDEQQISNEYEAYGVIFEMLDKNTGDPIGFPHIAKAGLPQTAFQGCHNEDTPLSGQGLGESFLTDDTSIGICGDLLITYITPVSQASGVFIDTDCSTNGVPPCEQWTIFARDANDVTLSTIVIDGPTGPSNPECIGSGGPGDGLGIARTFDLPSEQIHSVLIRLTGSTSGVGIAFDNFSPATTAPPLSITVSSSPWNKICLGESVELSVEVTGGTLPLTYQWQEESAPETWIDLGTEVTQEVSPDVTTNYRIIVTDADSRQAISNAFVIGVCLPTPDINGDGCVDLVDFAIMAMNWVIGCDE